MTCTPFTKPPPADMLALSSVCPDCSGVSGKCEGFLRGAACVGVVLPCAPCSAAREAAAVGPFQTFSLPAWTSTAPLLHDLHSGGSPRGGHGALWVPRSRWDPREHDNPFCAGFDSVSCVRALRVRGVVAVCVDPPDPGSPALADVLLELWALAASNPDWVEGDMLTSSHFHAGQCALSQGGPASDLLDRVLAHPLVKALEFLCATALAKDPAFPDPLLDRCWETASRWGLVLESHAGDVAPSPPRAPWPTSSPPAEGSAPLSPRKLVVDLCVLGVAEQEFHPRGGAGGRKPSRVRLGALCKSKPSRACVSVGSAPRHTCRGGRTPRLVAHLTFASASAGAQASPHFRLPVTAATCGIVGASPITACRAGGGAWREGWREWQRMPWPLEAVCARCRGGVPDAGGAFVTPRRLLCWACMLEEHGLYVDASHIPGAGLGLFTRRPIGRGARLPGGYFGLVVRAPGGVPDGVDASYVMSPERGVFVDAFRRYGTVYRYMNDCRGSVRVRWLTRNTVRCERCDAGALGMFAAQDIAWDDELLMGYGSRYWGDSA